MKDIMYVHSLCMIMLELNSLSVFFATYPKKKALLLALQNTYIMSDVRKKKPVIAEQT